jgi:hypothetical protein
LFLGEIWLKFGPFSPDPGFLVVSFFSLRVFRLAAEKRQEKLKGKKKKNQL